MLACSGDTQVICTASVEEGVPPFMKGQGRGWVTAEYGMLPRATHTRARREVSAGKASGRTLEIQRLIGRSLRAVTDLGALGERSILIDCDVIQADGGTRTASISGAFVALVLALRKLHAATPLAAPPIRGWLASVSVGWCNGAPLLDLDYTEDASADVDLNVVMTGDMHLVEVQGTAEGEAFPRAALNAMLDYAEVGVRQRIAAQQEVLGGRLL